MITYDIMLFLSADDESCRYEVQHGHEGNGCEVYLLIVHLLADPNGGAE
jgi:hypothetical protein